MNKRGFVWSLAAFAVAFALTMTAGTALAAGWNHDYTDASNDTTYANVDITRVKSYVQGTDVILELTVRGVIEDSSNVAYEVYTAGQGSSHGMFYANGTGTMFYQGGSNLNVTEISPSVIQGRMPRSGAGSESSFDVVGFSWHTSGSVVDYDYAGAAYQGGDGTGGGIDTNTILGMAFGLFLLVLLVPIIILIVIIVVIVLVLKQQRPSVPPRVQQSPYPQQQYPQQPPQQHPPPPQQYPPQSPPPQPPGQ